MIDTRRWIRVAILSAVGAAVLLPIVGLAMGKHAPAHSRWKSPEYEFAFGPPPQLAVTYEGETYPGVYTMRGRKIQATSIGRVVEGTWDGKRLVLADTPLERLDWGDTTLPAIPEQSFTPGRWHVVMASHVAQGFICEMYEVLERHGVPEERVRTFGKPDESYEPLRELFRGTADRATMEQELRNLASTVRKGDGVLLVIASHMTKEDMSIGMTYRQLDEQLALFPKETIVAVVLEGCNSGAGLQYLNHADIAYASVPGGKGSYGAFLVAFVHAWSVRRRFREADVDGNGIVTLGEAFDQGSKTERIEAFYKAPINGRVPQRRTSEPGIDYTVSLVPFAFRLYPK